MSIVALAGLLLAIGCERARFRQLAPRADHEFRGEAVFPIDEDWLATIDEVGIVRYWDCLGVLENEVPLERRRTASVGMTSVAMTSGRRILVSTTRSTCVVDPSGIAGALQGVAIHGSESPDGRLVITLRDEPREAVISDLATCETIGRIPLLKGDYRLARFVRGGTHVVLGYDLVEYQLASVIGDTCETFEGRLVNVSDDGTRALVAHRNGAAVIRDLADETPTVTLESSHSACEFLDAYVGGFSVDGSIVFAWKWNSDEIDLWEADTGRLLVRCRAPGNTFRRAIISHDGQRLAAANFEGCVFLWHVPSGARSGVLRMHSKGVSALQFSKDDRRLLSTSFDDTACVTSLDTNELLLRHDGFPLPHGSFLADGQRVLISSYVDVRCAVFRLPSAR